MTDYQPTLVFTVVEEYSEIFRARPPRGPAATRKQKRRKSNSDADFTDLTD